MQHSLDTIYAIAHTLNAPYDDVIQHCMEICAMSPLPADQVCRHIYEQVLSKRTLAQIREDFEKPVEALKRQGDKYAYIQTIVTLFENGLCTKEEIQKALLDL